MEKLKNAIILLHQAIHDKDLSSVHIDENMYSVQTTPRGLRYINYHGVRFMQQNPLKSGRWAKMARSGVKITWAMIQPAWLQIINGKITNPQILTTIKQYTERRVQV